MAATRVYETTAKSIMTRSKIPGIDYAINPYVGCQHACVYCYAVFMKKFLRIDDPWGAFVGVKVNAPEVLAKEARRRAPGVVSFGTVCDPYQEVERDYRITRACLEVFTEVEGFDVGVLTKSDLVVRDADVLERIPDVSVGFTITTLDPDVAAALEPGAPPPSRRLAAMRELSVRGIAVWGFFGPILPGLSDSEEAVAEVLGAMTDAGADHILVDRMNPYPKVLARLRPALASRFPDAAEALRAVLEDPGGYDETLRRRIRKASRGLDGSIDEVF